ncbi:MAG: serine protease [Bacteroidota bacterium]|nr:serine protease [Bacteroidota bacterium]
MFAKAYSIAADYTFPVLGSFRYFDGTIESGLGSFVIINDEGWIITAAHILDPTLLHQKQSVEIQKYNQEKALIENNPALAEKEKQRRFKKMHPNQKWISNYSMWWGADHHFIKSFFILKENDFAIGKIENYNPAFAKQYPVFKDPATLLHGTSLCKLGFPFYDVKPTFDEKLNRFAFDPSIFPIPRFPIEGIFTRNIAMGKSADGKYDIRFIETSSPGLRGHSGGPTFDRDGKIWAIQSQTRHFPLGFSPKIKIQNKEVQENQFLNVGWGAHVGTILKFLDAHEIKYQTG